MCKPISSIFLKMLQFFRSPKGVRNTSGLIKGSYWSTQWHYSKRSKWVLTSTYVLGRWAIWEWYCSTVPTRCRMINRFGILNSIFALVVILRTMAVYLYVCEDIAICVTYKYMYFYICQALFRLNLILNLYGIAELL